ncbi:MAG TPA: ArsR family transcriptional regulator, partial [Candidatus Acidoferrum sp.]|nr:ArsR family transcriptional regulator [Candidatus Acidoferrum sp.]
MAQRPQLRIKDAGVALASVDEMSSSQVAESTSFIAKVLLDDARRRTLKHAAVLGALSDGELQTQENIGQLLQHLYKSGIAIEQSTLSHHLKILRKVGLLQSQKVGLQRFFSLNPEGATKAVTILSKCLNLEITEDSTIFRFSEAEAPERVIALYKHLAQPWHALVINAFMVAGGLGLGSQDVIRVLIEGFGATPIQARNSLS